MDDQTSENKQEYPWNDTLRTLLIALLPSIAVLLVFQSKAAAIFVFAIMSYCRTWQDLRILLMCGLVAVTLRTAAYEPFNIPSGSMKSTLLIGDYLFVSKYSYGYSRYSIPLGLPLFKGRVLEFNRPQRGDVVVFREPSNTRIDFIKRLIGLPGDHIQVKEGIVYINGTPLARRPLPDFADDENKNNVRSVPRYAETLPGGKVIGILKERNDGFANNTPIFDVPEGMYFMMGDNRDNSHDSRFLEDVGYVPAENLVGRAEVIFFSTDGSAELLNPASWFKAMRVDRFFKKIE